MTAAAHLATRQADTPGPLPADGEPSGSSSLQSHSASGSVGAGPPAVGFSVPCHRPQQHAERNERPFWTLVCKYNKAAEDNVESRGITESHFSSPWQVFSSIFCLPYVILEAVRPRVWEAATYPGRHDEHTRNWGSLQRLTALHRQDPGSVLVWK